MLSRLESQAEAIMCRLLLGAVILTCAIVFVGTMCMWLAQEFFN